MNRLLSAALLGLCAALAAGCGTVRADEERAAQARPEAGRPPIDAALVTPRFGWILTPDRLLVTRDGGSSFADVTTPLPATPARAAYFYDADHGLAAAAQGRQITLAVTADGGRSWRTKMLRGDAKFSGLRIAFGDADHGAVLAKIQTSQAFSNATLFATRDGGATWTARPAPVAGEISVEPGGRTWLAGGVIGDQLHSTLDQGRTWTRAKLKLTAAAETLAVSIPAKGILPVTVVRGGTTEVATLATADDGRTWSETGRVAVRGKTGPGVRVPVAATAAGPLIVDNAGRHAYRLTGRPASITATGTVTAADLKPTGLPEGVYTLRFADGRAGWALTSHGRCANGKTGCTTTHELLATTDGGSTWWQLRHWVEQLG